MKTIMERQNTHMYDLVVRKATNLDMNDIMKLQVNVFSGEHKIPEHMIEVIGEEPVQWWCVTIN